MENDYDYICTTCGNEITVPFDTACLDPPPIFCEECCSRFTFTSKEDAEENDKINFKEQ